MTVGLSREEWRVQGTIPFTNERKRSTVILEPPGDDNDVVSCV